MKASKLFISLISISTLLSIPASYAASNANKPLVGSCYNYSYADVAGDGSTKGPVKCSATHTAETYRVTTWKDSRSPFEIDHDTEWEIANKLCQPWRGQSRTFNYWAYYLPTETQWDQGQRWIRCDAMVAADENASSFISWKGKRLDIR